jgi:hypothetical protein
MQAIVQRTVEPSIATPSFSVATHGEDHNVSAAASTTESGMELKIIQSPTDIMQPPETDKFV